MCRSYFQWHDSLTHDRTITIVENLGKNPNGEAPTKNQLFIAPYNYQAQSDLYLVASEVAKRQPDGVAFDYVRVQVRLK